METKMIFIFALSRSVTLTRTDFKPSADEQGFDVKESCKATEMNGRFDLRLGRSQTNLLWSESDFCSYVSLHPVRYFSLEPCAVYQQFLRLPELRRDDLMLKLFCIDQRRTETETNIIKAWFILCAGGAEAVTVFVCFSCVSCQVEARNSLLQRPAAPDSDESPRRCRTFLRKMLTRRRCSAVQELILGAAVI